MDERRSSRAGRSSVHWQINLLGMMAGLGMQVLGLARGCGG